MFNALVSMALASTLSIGSVGETATDPEVPVERGSYTAIEIFDGIVLGEGPVAETLEVEAPAELGS